MYCRGILAHLCLRSESGCSTCMRVTGGHAVGELRAQRGGHGAGPARLGPPGCSSPAARRLTRSSPAGMMLGNDCTVGQVVWQSVVSKQTSDQRAQGFAARAPQIPATVGNIIGGAFVVSARCVRCVCWPRFADMCMCAAKSSSTAPGEPPPTRPTKQETVRRLRRRCRASTSAQHSPCSNRSASFSLVAGALLVLVLPIVPCARLERGGVILVLFVLVL
jgi:hypothetical protein